MNALEKLKEFTITVADTCDFQLISKYRPQDATTNPSLVYKAARMEQYSKVIEDTVNEVKNLNQCPLECKVAQASETLVIRFGEEILKIVEGRVSTEVDARLAFDIDGQVEAAKRIIAAYEKKGIHKNRILIKLPSTWEGIKAAEILQQQPYEINCNLTLLFSPIQAQACAEANVTLISPFVGRILDWYKMNKPDEVGVGSDDPGVRNVLKIFEIYRRLGAKTQIMGASFRNVEEILALVGIDLVTVSPELMAQLSEMTEKSVRKRLDRSSITDGVEVEIIDQPIKESVFRWHMNEDRMANEKLSEGIRNFAADASKLEDMLRNMLQK